jgi:hypothetical protein
MDEAPPGRRPTRLVAAAVVLFLVAVLLGRLLLAGGAAWVALALIVPLVLFVLTAASSFRVALVATGLFVLGVLAVRWLLERTPTGWVPLLLLPVLAFTAMLVGRVLGQMRRDRLERRQGQQPGETGPAPKE